MRRPAPVVLSLELPPAKFGIEPLVPFCTRTFRLSTPVGILSSSMLKTRRGSRSAAARAGSPNSFVWVCFCHLRISAGLTTALPLRFIIMRHWKTLHSYVQHIPISWMSIKIFADNITLLGERHLFIIVSINGFWVVETLVGNFNKESRRSQ